MKQAMYQRMNHVFMSEINTDFSQEAVVLGGKLWKIVQSTI